MEYSFSGAGNMSGMQQHTYKTVVFANENRWYEPESMQEMFQGCTIQSG